MRTRRLVQPRHPRPRTAFTWAPREHPAASKRGARFREAPLRLLATQATREAALTHVVWSQPTEGRDERPPAAAMLAKCRNCKAIGALRGLCDPEDVVIDEPQAFAALSTHFHERVMELAGNQSLALFVGMLHDIIQSHAASSMEASNNPKSRRRAVRSQRKLLDLIEAGDVEGAEEHWRAHVKGAGRAILDHTGAKTVLDLFD